MSLERAEIGTSKEPQFSKLRRHELGSLDFTAHLQEFQFRSMSALEILIETFKILRYNSIGFIGITSLLICPVSSISLSNVLVDYSLVKRLTIRLLLTAKATGLPLNPLLNQSCHKFSDMVISTIMCFPLYITLLLLSKAAVVYSVDCSYSKKQFNTWKFSLIVRKLWKRVISTYIWSCILIVGLLAFFLVNLVVICNMFLILGVSTETIFYPGVLCGLVFSIVFANAIIIYNVAIVISVLEDASGPQALLRSSMLIRGQTQVGLLMYLGSTIGMAFVQALFEHRVKTLSNGDGSNSRLWEGPILVVLYSLVILIDSMMSAVFYFSCRSLSMEWSRDGETQPILEMVTL